MSNYLAVAAVTATLQQIVASAVRDKMPGAEVTTVRPDAIASSHHSFGVNIYPFEVAPNAALRNHDLPTRTGNGDLASRPQVAVNILYLFTFYGKEERLEPERLLGATLIALHSVPYLTRDEITEAIGSIAGNILAGADLALQTESVKMTPQALSLEALHRLWSIFNVPYRLSTVYEASVLQMDAGPQPARALPVRRTSVAATDRVDVPRLLNVIPQRVPWSDGAQIRLSGMRFTEGSSARIDEDENVPAEFVSASALQVQLPAALAAGRHAISVLEGSGVGESDRVPFFLLPVISRLRQSREADPRVEDPDALLSLVRLISKPAIGDFQNADLILNRVGGGARVTAPLLRCLLTPVPRPERQVTEELRAAFAAVGFTLSAEAEIHHSRSLTGFWVTDPSNEQKYWVGTSGSPWMLFFGLSLSDAPGTAAFQLPALPAGNYLARLRIDEAESELTLRPTGEYSGPMVVIR